MYTVYFMLKPPYKNFKKAYKTFYNLIFKTFNHKNNDYLFELLFWHNGLQFRKFQVFL